MDTALVTRMQTAIDLMESQRGAGAFAVASKDPSVPDGLAEGLVVVAAKLGVMLPEVPSSLAPAAHAVKASIEAFLVAYPSMKFHGEESPE